MTNSASGWLGVSTAATTVSFSGTPTTTAHLGLSTITVTAQDSFDESITATFTINVSSQPLTLSTATINHETFINKEFSYGIAFNNPNNSILEYTITIPKPTSEWLTVSTADTTVSFSGTPTMTAHLGLSTITVTAQDSFDETITATFTINVSGQLLTLSTATVNHEIFINKEFSYGIAFNNPNDGTFNYRIAGTDLTFEWLRVSTDDTTVSFSGTPTMTAHLGLSTITVTAQDSFDESIAATFTINVSGQLLTLSTATVNHEIFINKEFSYGIAFNNPNDGTFNYRIAGTDLTFEWLRVSTDDTTVSFSGTPTMTAHLGLSTITVTAQDSFDETITATFTINVSGQPLTLSTATVNHEIFINKEFSYGIAFNNPNDGTFNYRIAGTDLTFEWLRVSTDDTTVSFSGTPTMTAHLGLSTITVTAQDSFDETIAATFTINVSGQLLTLSTTTINHEIFVNKEFAYEIAFNNPNNGTFRYTITIPKPASSPSGWLTASTADTTVSFSGTPTSITHLGLSTITVTAQDSFGESTSTAFTINVSSRPLTLSTATINHETFINKEFSYEIAFNNPNDGTFRYTVTIPKLTSEWLTVSTADTTVSFNGMPINITHLGLSTITVTAQDSFDESITATFTINVSSQPLTLSTATINHETFINKEFSYGIAFNNPNDGTSQL